MDGTTLLENVAFVGVIGGGISFVIQFIKTLLAKLPWKWCQKIPGEVWIALSVVFGIAVTIMINYNALTEAFGSQIPVSGTLAEVITGTLIGASSKVVHAVATPIGAKLKTAKEEAIKAEEVVLQVEEPVTPMNTPTEALVEVPQYIANDEVLLMKYTTNNPDCVIVNGVLYKLEKGDSNA